jgi:heme oxygenase (biliverdin-producing, ferredoxin)
MSSRTFCATIKERTSAAHQRAESQVFVRALLNGELNVRSLVLLLENLEPVYDELEAQLRLAPDDPSVSLFDHRLLDRASRLRSDLHGLGRRMTSRQGQATRDYVRIVRESAASPQRLLAHHYTRYLGDLAGGQAIASLVERHYGVSRSRLSYYDFSDLGDLVHYRKQYRALLDLLPWTPTEQAEFITECEVAFDANSRLFAELAVDCGLRAPHVAAAAGFMSSERAHVGAMGADRRDNRGVWFTSRR